MLLIYIEYRNDAMWHPRRLFTFGRQGEGAYLKKGGNQGQGFFFLITSRTCKTKLSCLFEKDFKKWKPGLLSLS